MRAEDRLFTLPFALAFAASFLSSLAFHGFVHLPGFLHDLGADEAEIGMIVGVMAAAAILARPTLGKLMDTRGRRVVLIGGGVLTAASCFLYLLVTDLGPLIYLVRVVHGVAEAAMFSVLFTIAADLSPPAKRTHGIAIFGVSGMLPLSLGGLLGDYILANGTYQHLFIVTGSLAAVAVLASLFIPESRPAPAVGAQPSGGFFVALKNPALRPLWLVGVAFALAVTSYFTFLKTHVLETGIGSVGLFFTAYAVAAVLLRVLFGWVPDRLGPKRVLFPSLLCLAAGISWLALADTDLEVAAAGILCGIGHGYAFPIISALVVNRTHAADRGSAMSIFTALFDTGLLIGSPVLGLLAEHVSYQAMFLAGASCAVAGALAFALIDRQR